MTRRSQPPKRIRVRSKRLDQLDETKLALALWLLAKDTLTTENNTQPGAASGPVIPPTDDTSEPEAA
jgi:hypothetical protein